MNRSRETRSLRREGTPSERTITLAPTAGSLTVGDFNNDGHLDLVVTNMHATVPDTNPGTLSLLGEGRGEFGSAKEFGVGDEPVAITTGDFNGDGHLDIFPVRRWFRTLDERCRLSFAPYCPAGVPGTRASASPR